MTHSLTYISQAIAPFSDADLKALVTTSQAYNATHAVTGALAYSNGWFLQVLEGETQVVKNLYNTIVRDPRHANLTIVLEGDIAERAFADWSMAMIRSNQTANDTLRNVRQIAERANLGAVTGGVNTDTASAAASSAESAVDHAAFDSIAALHAFIAPPRLAIQGL